jgi:hypothetical protein
MRNPRCLPVGLLPAAFLAMGSAMARADDGSIVLDFVRHGEAGDMTVVNTLVPGPNLTDTGEQLFVDFRDLITAPQFAGYDIYEALLTGNSATIETAIQAGVGQIDTALAQFPVAVFDDVVSAFGGAI